MGVAKHGEAEGRKGNIIERIGSARSVDFVTLPGAGGKILALMESMRNKEDKMAVVDPVVIQVEVDKKLEERITALEAENKALVDKVVGLEARTTAEAALASTDLPEPAKTRILEAVIRGTLPIKEGKLDSEAFNATLKGIVDTEKSYVLSLIGESGRIRGMGPTTEGSKGELKASLKSRYLREGKTEAEAEQMAEIVVRGR
jgi:hypothetical protein